MSQAQATSESDPYCACFPDNACKVAACSLAIVVVCAVALTIIILLPKDPGLNTTFYPVFGGVGALCFVALVLSLVAWCKKRPKEPEPQFVHAILPQQTQPQVIVLSPQHADGRALIPLGRV